tara:strand:+ start:493 stop:726 length:234 start_codon:yes stop_codon:yes gene_type:complete
MRGLQDNERLFNNADSFAMVFDNAWKESFKKVDLSKISSEERLDYILNQVKDHPFFISNPKRAKEVAIFRIRLLNLT